MSDSGIFIFILESVVYPGPCVDSGKWAEIQDGPRGPMKAQIFIFYCTNSCTNSSFELE
jgi:hypothetical protein